MRRKLFISYRRDDAKAEARSIYQHMAQTFGSNQIFMDVDSIQKGLDFGEVLENTLKETAVMIVVMGRTWLSTIDENGQRRLDNPADYVHMEIATALANGLPVIPVRVDGARLPRPDELPAALQPLTRRQGTVVSHESFDSDIRGLEADVQPFIGPGDNSRNGLRFGLWAAGIVALAAAGAGIFFWARHVSSPPPSPASAAASAIVNTASDTVRAAAGWADAHAKKSFEAYRGYLRTFPNGEHRKAAADAAVAALQKRLNDMVDDRVSRLRNNTGDPSGYLKATGPRTVAMCIAWMPSSFETLTIGGWGSYWAADNWKGPAEEVDQRAMATCNSMKKDGAQCDCTIAHRNGSAVLQAPVDWISRQLR